MAPKPTAKRSLRSSSSLTAKPKKRRCQPSRSAGCESNKLMEFTALDSPRDRKHCFVESFELQTDPRKSKLRRFMVQIILEKMIRRRNLRRADQMMTTLSTSLVSAKNSYGHGLCYESCDHDLITVSTLRTPYQQEDSGDFFCQLSKNSQDPLDYSSYRTCTHSNSLENTDVVPVCSLLDEFNLTYMENDELEYLITISMDLGQGSYGQTFLCYAYGRMIVLKKVYCSFSFCQELSSLLLVKGMQGHQQVIAVNASNMIIASEFAGLDLTKWLQFSRFSKSEELLFINKLAKALHELHALGYTHNDVKVNNVCVKRTETGLEVSLIDYGLAALVGEVQRFKGMKVSFMAPEIFEGEGASEASDVYSLGYMLQEMMEGGYLKGMTDEVKFWTEDSVKDEKYSRPALQKLIQLTESHN
ncbi:serine/threonine-protein kinase pakC-like [Macrobrachium rosenbergii]|uniref:serine/threonine-protein kinase pakC-like n=1 Tax=Macrobrachium rosenbergii TaxID=79674 RepID=UPI0034D409C6